MATLNSSGTELLIDTDCFSAAIATTGYTSGVKTGSFRDKKTGSTDLGFGLDIVDFLLEPAEGKEQDPSNPYHFGDLYHGSIAKRYIELPQICTQAKELPFQVFRGPDFVAVRQWYRWHQATQGFKTGSLWEQVLVFPDGQRHFIACDRVTSVNDSDALILRIDMPGHLKHRQGDTFSEIYLSYQGRIPSSAFLEDSPPDARNWYRRDDASVPRRMVRAYRVRTKDGDGPWLAGMTLDPADVYEAWCHQRSYVCFIQEIGGRPIKAGERFGAAYVIGFFDSIEEMNAVYDRFKGARGIAVTGHDSTARWYWKNEP